MSLKLATFAAGCFWGVEEIFRKLPGVKNTKVGFSGGHVAYPSYKLVRNGLTDHAEAVQVFFEDTEISFETLLNYFFRLHDPTTVNRQGDDVGTMYRSVIFYHSEEQKSQGLVKMDEVSSRGYWHRPLVTQIRPFEVFYDAEEYHQAYLQKNPNGYNCHWIRE